MALKVITPPAIEPVSLSDVKEWLRYTQTLQDARITALITTARTWVEDWTNRTLINTVYEFYTDALTNEIDINTSTIDDTTVVVTYTDTDNAEQTLTSTLYGVDNISPINKIFREPNQCYPASIVKPNGVKISFTAGFGVAQSDVPENFKTAIYTIIGAYFENREAFTEATVKENPIIAQTLGLGADFRS